MTEKIVAEPMSTNDIVEVVSFIRRSMGLADKLYFPVLKFVELIIPKVLDDNFEFNVVEKGQMPDKYALYDPQRNQMIVREDVYEKAYQGDGRHRFTIAHEIRHYFLHRNGVKLARVSSDYVVQAYRNPEWQANVFAAELLMPKRLISGLSIEEIQSECCTSFQAAKIAFDKAKKSS